MSTDFSHVRVGADWKPLAPLDAGSDADAPNVIVNPHFKTDVSDWRTSYSGGHTAVAWDGARGKTAPGSAKATLTGHNTNKPVGGDAMELDPGSGSSQAREPVIAGHRYRVSGWMLFTRSAANSAGAPEFGIDCDWFDAATGGTRIRRDNPPPFTPVANDWVHVTGTFTAPAGATHVGLAFKLNNVNVGESFWLDDVECYDLDIPITPPSFPAYVNVGGAWKPAAEGWVRVGADWKRLWPVAWDGGLLGAAGGFPDAASLWTAGAIACSITLDTAKGRTDPPSMAHLGVSGSSVNANDVPIQPGQTIHFSGWAWHDHVPAPNNARLTGWWVQITFKDSAGHGISAGNTIVDAPAALTGQWQEITASAVAPAGAVSCRIRVVPGGDNVHTTWFDDFKVTIT